MPFAIYRVADISRYGRFTLLAQYEKSGASVNQLEQEDALDWRTQAQTLAAWIQTNNISEDARKSTDKQGKAVFSQLKTGLYLVISSNANQNGTEYCSAPFLISVPEQASDGTAWTYAVTANPKSEPSGNHTDQPTNKPDSSDRHPSGSDTASVKKNLPYTGILQWPIPVLAGTGLVLMILGWRIKKNKNNK